MSFLLVLRSRVGNGMSNGVRSLRRGGAQGAGRRARVKWLGKKIIKIKRERRKDLVESKKSRKKRRYGTNSG